MLQTINYGIFHREKSGWERLIVDSSLGKYLRELFRLYTYNCKDIFPPSRGTHITLSDPQKLDKKFEELSEGQQVEFNLELALFTNGNAVWCPVKIEDYEGLPEKPLHFCFGYLTQKATPEKHHNKKEQYWRK